MVYWYNKEFLENVTAHSKRLSRQDPKYYLELYVHTLVTADNNMTVSCKSEHAAVVTFFSLRVERNF